MSGIVITDEILERAARNILRADGVKYVEMDGEWEADVKRYHEMCAKFPDYASGGGLITDAFRRARAALALVPHPPEGGKEAGEPVAWVIPGDDNTRDNGFIDAMAWQEGEFSRPLYASPIPARDTGRAEGTHPDDLAVDRFAVAMKAKLAKKREEGRGGWDDPEASSVSALAYMLVDHLPKGDPVDIGNFAMMLHQRHAPNSVLSEAIAALTAPLRAAEVKVTPLEWKFGVDDSRRYCAETIVGFYWISENGPGEFYLELNMTGIGGWRRSLDEAKAAAQQDYETRILSSLSLPPGTGEKDERIAELERALAKIAIMTPDEITQNPERVKRYAGAPLTDKDG